VATMTMTRALPCRRLAAPTQRHMWAHLVLLHHALHLTEGACRAPQDLHKLQQALEHGDLRRHANMCEPARPAPNAWPHPPSSRMRPLHLSRVLGLGVHELQIDLLASGRASAGHARCTRCGPALTAWIERARAGRAQVGETALINRL